MKAKNTQSSLPTVLMKFCHIQILVSGTLYQELKILLTSALDRVVSNRLLKTVFGKWSHILYGHESFIQPETNLIENEELTCNINSSVKNERLESCVKWTQFHRSANW